MSNKVDILENVINEYDPIRKVINIINENKIEIIEKILDYNNINIVYCINILRLNCSFQGKIVFNFDTVLINEVSGNFTNCIFNKTFKISAHNITNCDFSNSVFNGESYFNNMIYSSSIKFTNAVFMKSANFEKAVFERDVDFSNAVFFDDQQFSKCVFTENVNFSKTTFNKQCQFINLKFLKNVILNFSYSQFKGGIDISRSNMTNNINFWNAEINTKPSDLWLYENDLLNNDNKVYSGLAINKLRESIRIIKNSFIQLNSSTNSLEYRVKENQLLKWEYYKSKDNHFSDKTILWFNKWSNYYGLRWDYGIGFTIISGVLFFSLVLLATSNELEFSFTTKALNKTIIYYLQYLNITNYNFQPYNSEGNAISYALFFLGKIFIGFGYYQTIQAFRKYGKN